MNLFSNNLITFVVQGPFYSKGINNTNNLLNSLHTAFPSAEIIYSTWKGVDKNLTYVRYILNNDPGEVETEIKCLKNIKRLIVSSQSGVNAASSNIIIKLRSDSTYNLKLKNNLLKLLSTFNSEKIGILMHSNPINLFFLDDKIQIGQADLMIKFWMCDIKPLDKEKLKVHNYNDYLNSFLSFKGIFYLSPEQMLFISYANIKLPNKISYFKLYKSYLSSLREYFIFLNAPKHGFGSLKWKYVNNLKLRLYLILMNFIPIKISTFTILSLLFFKKIKTKISKNLY